MTRKRTLLMLFILIGLSIIILTQCSQSKEQPLKTSTDQVITGIKGNAPKFINESQTLKVTVSMQPEEYIALQRKSAEYTRNHEDIKIELNNVTDGYTALKKANQIGDGPDLMLLDNQWVNEFAALGFLRPMDEFFTGEQQSDGITELMNQVKWNGYLWAIPKDVDPYILVWNNAIAMENNWSHAPESVEEWLEWNKVLMQPEQGKYGIYIDFTDPYAFLSVLSTFEEMGTESDYLSSLKNPIVIKQLESFLVPQEETYMGSYLKQNYPAPSSEFDPWQLLKLGKIGAMITTVSEYKLHSNSITELAALSITDSISFRTVNNGLLKGRSYAISSHSKNEILAINWIKEMTTAGTDLIAWDEAKLLPSIPTAYLATPDSSGFNSTSYQWLINHGRVLPVSPVTTDNIRTFMNKWYQVWEGKETLKSFMDSTSRLWAAKPASL